MKKLLLLFIIFLCVYTHLSAQKKYALRSISSIGLLNGSKGAAFSVQSILGVAVKQSFAGIGVGIDQYSFRSVPVFIDVRQEMGRKLRNVFLYGDAGFNADWLPEKDRQQFVSYNFRGGLYYDAGIGYTIPVKNYDALLFSLGYSYKELRNTISPPFCITGICNVTKDVYVYHMPRILIKAGLRF